MKSLFKLCYEEFLYNNEITSSWNVYLKINDKHDYLLYSTPSENWAKIALSRLRELYDMYILNFIMEKDLPTMFEINNQIYKLEYVLPGQSCVIGSNIPGNQRYGEFSIEPEKFDYIHDFIFFYNKGQCVVKSNQVFLDGELLYNSNELYKLCGTIQQDFKKLDSDPNKLIDYLKIKFPNITSYSCNGYCSFFVKGEN